MTEVEELRLHVKRLDERLMAMEIKVQQLITRADGQQRHTLHPVDTIGDVIDGIFHSTD